MGAPLVSRSVSAAPHNRAAYDNSPCTATTRAQLLIECQALLKPRVCLCQVTLGQMAQPRQVEERVGKTGGVSKFLIHLQTIFEQAACSDVLTLIDDQVPQVDQCRGD